MIRYSYLKETLATVTDSGSGDSVLSWLGPLLLGFLDNANTLLGVMQCLSCVVVFILYGFLNFPTEQYRCWMKATNGKHSFNDALRMARRGDPYWIAQVLYRTPIYFATNVQLAFYTFLFVASILGLTVSPFWFSVRNSRPLTPARTCT